MQECCVVPEGWSGIPMCLSSSFCYFFGIEANQLYLEMGKISECTRSVTLALLTHGYLYYCHSSPVLYHLSGSWVWDTLQFIDISFEPQDYEGFKLPLCQSTNRLHQGLQRYQGKIRHISAGSVKLYQTLGFPGNFDVRLHYCLCWKCIPSIPLQFMC